jgi:hypothetical protein
MDDIDYGKCECCQKEPAIGVACIPGIAISIAWCMHCIEAEVVPYNIAVFNTAMNDGLENSADWWKEIVNKTMKYFNISNEQFNNDLEQEISHLKLMDDTEDQPSGEE